MHHVLITVLLALTLFTSSLSTSSYNFIEERVSLCAEAIESIQHSTHQQQQRQHRQLQLLRVHVIDATPIDVPPATTTSSLQSSTMHRAAMEEAAKAKKARQHRSRLIAEMARDLTKTSDSVASSTGSKHGTVSTDSTATTHDFNPEKDEAIMSTRQLHTDYSQKLPQIRDTAKKYGRWAPRPQQDYVIDTSAIGRAFPDFSGGVSSDDDYSIEVGRGNNTRPNNSNNIYTDQSNDASSPVVTFNNHQILQTPQNPRATTSKPYLQEALRNFNKQNTSTNNAFSIERKEIVSTQYNKQSSKSNNTFEIEQKENVLSPYSKQHTSKSHNTLDIEQKENIPPKSNIVSPYTSNASRITNGKRRTLHARVADESDLMDTTRSSSRSILQPRETKSSFRPETSLASARSNTQRRHEQSSAQLEPFSRSRVNSQKAQTKANTAKSLTQNPTQSSFVAPPLPESSEQGTGTFDIGVPVSVQDGRVKSRLESSQKQQNGDHEPVDGFELPDDEEDIYLMCEVQKERIAQLEEERAKSDRRIRELEIENTQIKHEHSQLKLEKKFWDSHQCVDKELEMEVAQFKREKKFWDSHKCVDKDLENEVAQLNVEKKAWESHECVDEQLEMENAQLKLDKAQFRLEKKTWDSHKCVDKDLEREIAQLKLEKKAWESHECTDEQLQEENAQLKIEMKAWESHRCTDRDLEIENAQLKLEKKNWESHRCSDSALGDSGSERGSTRYKQLKFEKTKLEEKFVTLKTRYETLERTKSRTELTEKTTTAERDEVVKQLNHAQVRAERIEEESNSLRQENELLKSQMDRLRVELRDQVQEIGKLSTQQQQRTTTTKSRKDEDMTSAFIIPDIVSDIGDEPTLRPTMGPVEALARVVKIVRDEIAHLKGQLGELQERYRIHNGSLAKRERIRIESAIKQLVDQISSKSDELYLLHDVELAQEKEDEEEGTELSLPWEGVESTGF